MKGFAETNKSPVHSKRLVSEESPKRCCWGEAWRKGETSNELLDSPLNRQLPDFHAFEFRLCLPSCSYVLCTEVHACCLGSNQLDPQTVR